MLVYAGNWDTPNKKRKARVHRWKLIVDVIPTLTSTAGTATTHDAVLVVPGSRQLECAMNAAAQLSIFSSAELPASRSVSPDSERDWLIRVATSRLRILPLLTAIGPSGWSGRTCPACCHRAKDGTLEPSSEGWGNSGMGGPTESWTLSTSDWPSAASVCSLSQVLEAGNVPRRFYLTPRACAGILRRAEKRGKDLPTPLRLALTSVAAGLATS